MHKQFNGKTKRVTGAPAKMKSPSLEEPLGILGNRAGISLINSGLSQQLYLGSIDGTDRRFVFQSFLCSNKSKCSHFYLIIIVLISKSKNNEKE